jgi:16S rRNA (guanine1207-N2)-methyltransferase
MESILSVPQGSFTLHRFPQRRNDKLRAWDAADEYLLQHLAENPELTSDATTLIINDSFGALSIALNTLKPIVVTDSWISQQATQRNLINNHLPEQAIQFKNSLDWPQQPVDLVLIKAPKTLALFEDQLVRLQTLLKPDTQIIIAGMVKTMPATIWKLMEKYLGPTTPSLSRKKARLIFTTLHPSRPQHTSPYPSYYQLENTPYTICNHANVFSRESLDIGSRFLLKHLPVNNSAEHIVDLGCGNGVIGLMLGQQHPEAHLNFVDESYMAIASAKENFQQAFAERTAEFHLGDGLTEFPAESMDLIVCNPPFHQQNTVGNHIALSMFRQSHRVLKPRGELWVIGNRHLAYHQDLKKVFGNLSRRAENTKFIIYQVKK